MSDESGYDWCPSLGSPAPSASAQGAMDCARQVESLRRWAAEEMALLTRIAEHLAEARLLLAHLVARARMARGRGVGLLVLGLLFVVPATTASAHPGRLDGEGCHEVRRPFVYADGRRLEVGERHCHRPLGVLRLDGTERLRPRPEEGQGHEVTIEEERQGP